MTRQPWAVSNPDQRIGLMATLAAYTLGGAYGEHADHHKGMVRAGYLADLVLLSGDIEALAHDEIGAMAVDLTICGGQITFDRLGQL